MENLLLTGTLVSPRSRLGILGVELIRPNLAHIKIKSANTLINTTMSKNRLEVSKPFGTTSLKKDPKL
jgi:hypothetical protein